MRSFPVIIVLGLGISVALQGCSSSEATSAQSPTLAPATAPFDTTIENNVQVMFEEGRRIFRYDTFGDEVFWSETLGLHRAIAGENLGGVGPGVSPTAALSLGLKVDMDALPPDLVAQIQAGQVDMNDPATTLALIRLNAVLGVVGTFGESGELEAVGLTCAVCHSSVDDAFAPGIGHRVDGMGNRDLNVGAIIASAPNLEPIATLLETDVATVKQVLTSWGPGKFDAELDKDGKAFRPDGKPAATIIPNAFGLAGVNLHTWTGAWGTVTYWNAYVANTELKGKGNFFDPRLNDPDKYPVSTRSGAWNMRSEEDLVTSKLGALHFYQLAIPPPQPPVGSFDAAAAERGETVFTSKAQCARCHVPPLFTEPGWNLHTADEIGIDDFQSSRSPDNRYRTAPLRAIWTRIDGPGFYHDGRFPDLRAVIDHYDDHLGLNLSESEKTDLVEYLKSL
jgi:hypothetical protein